MDPPVKPEDDKKEKKLYLQKSLLNQKGGRLPTAIVGVYPVTARAVGPGELRDALAGSGKSGDMFRMLRAQRGERNVSPCLCPDIDLSEYTDSKHAYLDPATKLALASSSGAMKDAGWTRGEALTGLSIGTAHGCSASSAAHARTVAEKGGKFSSPLVFSHSYPNSPNAVVSIDLGLRGYNNCVVAGSVSGLIAIGSASDQISAGRSERILAGGMDGGADAAACFLALRNVTAARSEDRNVYAEIMSWSCGRENVDTVLETAVSAAGLEFGRLGVIAGVRRDEITNRFVGAGDVIGPSAAAAGVLDIAALCVLASSGWAGNPPETANAAVIRKNTDGTVCVVVLDLSAAGSQVHGISGSLT